MINKVIKPSSFSRKKLIELGRLVEELHQECKDQFFKEIKNKTFHLHENVESDQEVLEHINQIMKLIYEVHSPDGAYMNFNSLNDIDSYDIPGRISKIKISTAALYNLIENRNPSTYFEMTLDFSETRVLDLYSSPTAGTSNNSYYFVCSSSYLVSDGISARIQAFLDQQVKLFTIIHYPGIYDASLYLIVIPATTTIVFLLKDRLPNSIVQLPFFLQLLTVISCLFLLLLTYRLLFNLGKWALPYLELEEDRNRIKNLLKVIYFTVMMGIISTIIFNFFAYLIEVINT